MPNHHTRLAQLMGMTGSVHDGEAINALRLANKWLAEHKLTWAELLNGPLPKAPPADLQRPRNEAYAHGRSEGFAQASNAYRSDLETMRARLGTEFQRGYDIGHAEGHTKALRDAALHESIAARRAELDAVRAAADWRAHAQGLLTRCLPQLSEWEITFLESIAQRERQLTEKQSAVLAGLRQKYKA